MQKADDFTCGIGLEQLSPLLAYNKDTGLFHWRVTRMGGQAYAGDIAGHVVLSGYTVIHTHRRLFWAHRLAWLFHYGEWPKCEIDHINRIKTDNRIANLRLATYSQNGHNATVRKRKHKAPRGVAVVIKPNGRIFYCAHITINRKRTGLGCYDTIEEAVAAYKRASMKLLGRHSPYWGADAL